MQNFQITYAKSHRLTKKDRTKTILFTSWQSREETIAVIAKYAKWWMISEVLCHESGKKWQCGLANSGKSPARWTDLWNDSTNYWLNSCGVEPCQVITYCQSLSNFEEHNSQERPLFSVKDRKHKTRGKLILGSPKIVKSPESIAEYFEALELLYKEQASTSDGSTNIKSNNSSPNESLIMSLDGKKWHQSTEPINSVSEIQKMIMINLVSDRIMKGDSKLYSLLGDYLQLQMPNKSTDTDSKNVEDDNQAEKEEEMPLRYFEFHMKLAEEIDSTENKEEDDLLIIHE
jgi:hypothetical protein